MYKLGFVILAFVAACGEPTHVSTSSVPPTGAADAGVAAPAQDAGTPGLDGGTPGLDGGTPGAGADGGAIADGGGAGADGGGAGADAGSVATDAGMTTCALSGPTRLASAHLVTKLIADGDQLYFLDVASAFAGLYRVGRTGGTPTLLASVAPLSSDGIDWDFAVGDTTVYLTFAILDDGFGASHNSVLLIDKASGATRSIPANAYGCPIPTFTRVTAAGGSAWLVQRNHVPSFGLSTCTQAPFDTIEALPAGATRSQTVATLAPGVTAIVADSTHLFWSGARGTFRALHDGSAVEALAPLAAAQLVTDGNALFAAVDTAVDVITAPQHVVRIFDGTSSDSPFGAAPAPIAVDDAHVFIATPSGVVAVGKDGAAPRTIVPTAARAVAVDATQLFYSDGATVMTVCK